MRIIRSLLALAQKLGLRVVAEGVEKHGQQAFLGETGCELLQGFRFARPMPDEKLRPWLSSIRNLRRQRRPGAAPGNKPQQHQLLQARADQLVRELDSFHRAHQQSVDRLARSPAANDGTANG